MKVAISVGHNPHKPGAKGPGAVGTTEYAEAVVMAAFAIRHLQYLGHRAYLIGTGPLEQKVKAINDLGVDVAVEFHLNHSAAGGHGCETLFCPGSVIGEDIAQKIHKGLTKAVGNRDRGVKPGWHNMDEPGVVDYPGDVDGDEAKNYFLRKTNCPAVIVEPYFIDTEDAAFNGGCEIGAKIGEAVAHGLLK